MSAQGEGPIDYAIGNGERLLGVLESAMDPGAVAAARDTIAAARAELTALRASEARLREAIENALSEFDLPDDAYSAAERAGIRCLRAALRGGKQA